VTSSHYRDALFFNLKIVSINIFKPSFTKLKA
jgi:hypothetical protein